MAAGAASTRRTPCVSVTTAGAADRLRRYAASGGISGHCPSLCLTATILLDVWRTAVTATAEPRLDIPDEASLERAPDLLEGARTLDLTAHHCTLGYWLGAVAQGTLQG